MHATSPAHTGEPTIATASDSPSTSGSRTWERAFADLRNGLRQRELWSHLGWQDIKQRYRRSVLGPLWITLSMAVTGVGLGLLYSVLFQQSISTFLPYIITGFIVWNFLLGCLTEGTDTFISNEGLIKHLPAPLTVYALRTVWRQALMFAHNLIVYFIMLAIFWGPLTTVNYQTTDGGQPQPGLNFSAFLAIPGFVLLALNACWVVLLFGIVSTRFRDIPQVITSLTSLLFFLTPIVWSPDIVYQRFGENGGVFELVYQLNPFYHFVQVVRAPLIGNIHSPVSWAIVGGFAVVGWIGALLVMRKYRARVAYWV